MNGEDLCIADIGSLPFSKIVRMNKTYPNAKLGKDVFNVSSLLLFFRLL